MIIPASTTTTEPQTHHHHHQYNLPNYTQQPHCTYVYHAPPPVDPLSQSRSTIHFISGLVKITGTIVVLTAALYLLSGFIKNMQDDMGSKIAKYEAGNLQFISSSFCKKKQLSFFFLFCFIELLGNQFYCQQQYNLNRCSPDTRLPAIVNLCREWEQCMFQPLSISKSKVLAETFADIANGFTDTLSTKTMVTNNYELVFFECISLTYFYYRSIAFCLALP
jgi:hypothetical protein